MEPIAGLALLAGAGMACLIRSGYERTQLEIQKYHITSEKIKTPRRLVFLSDLHDHSFGRENSRLLAAIHRAEPDAVLIGGDMMVCRDGADRTDTEVAMTLIQNLRKKYPVYYGNGNHETRMKRQKEETGSQYDRYRSKLLDLGVILLEDAGALLGEDILISSVELERRHYKRRKPDSLSLDFLEKKLGKADSDRFQILLAHSPLFFQSYSKWGADLTLSGHFHGGTIRLPWLGGVMTPQFQFFFPWCRGMFEKDGCRMIVSPGLGTHSINIRLNNKPQLVVVELENRTIF